MAIPFRLAHSEGDRIGFEIALDGSLWNSTATDLDQRTENYGILVLESAAEQTGYNKKIDTAYSENYTVVSNILTDNFSNGVSSSYKKYNIFLYFCKKKRKTSFEEKKKHFSFFHGL